MLQRIATSLARAGARLNLEVAAGQMQVYRAWMSQLPCTTRPAGLLLDAGDTLIFFDGAAMAAALRDQGESCEPARLEASLHAAKRRYQQGLLKGASHEDGWSILVLELLAQAGIASARARELLPALRRVHDDFYFWRRVPDGLIAALTRARAEGMRIGVISNSEGKLRSVFDRVGLLPYLDLVVDSHLEGVQKPDPEIFRRALLRLELAPNRAIYAGDIPEVDVLGARGAGMEGVVVDAFGDYEGTDWPRVRSVAELIDKLLALP